MVEHIQRGSETHYLSYISSPDGLVAMHISDDNGRDEMKYVLTDYLGTIYALVDDGAQSTDDALYYSFNAWGERRELQAYDGSLTAPLFSDPAAYITSRGYTGHEHIDAFDLINMNGRAYDPVVGAFLSPDPYVQAPDMPQNLNRYAYCLNNPLKYSDPSGEFFIEAMMIGAFTNIFFQGVTGNLHNLGDALFAGGIGALSGAVGFGAGQMVAGVAGNIGFAAGAVTGASGGFAGGFVGGAANAWANGASFLDGLTQGFIGGTIGAGIGGLSGGISGGIRANKLGLKFWSGTGTVTSDMPATASLPSDPGEPTNISNGLELTKHTFENYPGCQDYCQRLYKGVENFKQIIDKGYYVEGDQLFNSAKKAVHGTTLFERKTVFGGGKSLISISPNMITHTNNLHAVVGHELIHAYHHYTGFYQAYGEDASEYFALKFSASVPHSTQYGAANTYSSFGSMQGTPYAITNSYVYPPWVQLH